MPEGARQELPGGIETFPSRARLDLQPLWEGERPEGHRGPALTHPWGPRHRPEWCARGLIVWPRGGIWWRLNLRCACPPEWRALGPRAARARLALRWWADAAEVRVDGEVVHRGDLFDTACRWALPTRWWEGEALELELRLRSPLHDDGALLHSRLELEPLDRADPHGLLAETRRELVDLRRSEGRPEGPGSGVVRVLGHAHLDLAWLWPVADTWRAAERTFASVLALMERFPALHFGHSTPALYAWLERHRPALYGRIRVAMERGRWEPLGGPWVETDCVLVSTASLLRQFQEGQRHAHAAFPEWEHPLAWLPDSFGFAAGLPAVAAATGVRWFCTHKLAWNAVNPFPHRLFRWRSPCGAEVMALMTPPIGTDGDPLAIERHRLAWQRASGCAESLWLPGVGDHGGGPTAEMLEQLALWDGQAAAAPQRHGTLRDHLATLEPEAPRLPVWRDELYLELHRGCATSRPDQKRHNRVLERLLREAETAAALASPPAAGPDPADWHTLLFHQFHDILPGTAIPEVFEQAEGAWRGARQRARRRRDEALGGGAARSGAGDLWRVVQLLPLPPAPRVVRLPAGRWSLSAGGAASGVSPAEVPAAAVALATQAASGGGVWVQVPGIAGADGLTLHRAPAGPGTTSERMMEAEPAAPVVVEETGAGRWRLGNGRVGAEIGPLGVEQLLGPQGEPLLAGPLEWRRWADRGEFWDAWDLAGDYRQHPLPWRWEEGTEWPERGPLCARFLRRGRCGGSAVRLEGLLRAGSAALELTLTVQWRQRHELLRLEIPLAHPSPRWAADTSGGAIERPARAATAREAQRWEVPAIGWMAAAGGKAELAVLLDGPQGVSASPERLGVSLLRGPTWPDPGADNGRRRQRLALMPCPGGWRSAAVPVEALRLREPLLWQPLGPGAAWPGRAFPALGKDLVPVGLRPAGDGRGGVILTAQNLGPCRRRLEPGPEWEAVARLDGLGRPLAGEASLALGPWALGCWRLRPRS